MPKKIKLTVPPGIVAFLKRPYFRYFHSKVAARTKDMPFDFMNYGYASLDEQAAKLTLEPKDEDNRLSAQLYHHVVSAVDVQGKNILEVGSGRGGGADFIHRYLKPNKLTGLDLCKDAVALSNDKFSREGLEFIAGDAQKIPFDDGV